MLDAAVLHYRNPVAQGHGLDLIMCDIDGCRPGALVQQLDAVGVVDIRSLAPLDRDGLAEHASAATRLLIVDDDYLRYGMSGEIAISIVERLGGSSPLIARHGLDISQPASRVLEQFVLPSAESIANHIRTWGA